MTLARWTLYKLRRLSLQKKESKKLLKRKRNWKRGLKQNNWEFCWLIQTTLRSHCLVEESLWTRIRNLSWKTSTLFKWKLTERTTLTGLEISKRCWKKATRDWKNRRICAKNFCRKDKYHRAKSPKSGRQSRNARKNKSCDRLLYGSRSLSFCQIVLQSGDLHGVNWGTLCSLQTIRTRVGSLR